MDMNPIRWALVLVGSVLIIACTFVIGSGEIDQTDSNEVVVGVKKTEIER